MRTRMGVAESISVIFWSRFRWYQDSLGPRAAPTSRPSLLQRFDEGRERGVVSQLGEGFVVDGVWHLLAGGEILFVGEGLPQMELGIRDVALQRVGTRQIVVVDRVIGVGLNGGPASGRGAVERRR